MLNEDPADYFDNQEDVTGMVIQNRGHSPKPQEQRTPVRAFAKSPADLVPPPPSACSRPTRGTTSQPSSISRPSPLPSLAATTTTTDTEPADKVPGPEPECSTSSHHDIPNHTWSYTY